MVSLNEKRVGGILFIKTNKYSWLLILWIWRTLPSMVNNLAHSNEQKILWVDMGVYNFSDMGNKMEVAVVNKYSCTKTIIH